MLRDSMDKKGAILGLVLLAFLLLQNFASADIPPPRLSVGIHITYNGEEVPDASFNAVLLCRDDVEQPPKQYLIPELDIIINDSSRNCTYKPFKVDQCRDSECYFEDFPYTYGKEGEYYDCILAVYLPSEDRVFLSDRFYAKTHYYNKFEATFLPNGTITLQDAPDQVEEVKWIPLELFLRILFLTLLFELIVAYIFCFLAKIPKKLLIAVVLANVISVSIVSITLPIVFTFLSNNVINAAEAYLWATAIILLPGVGIFVFEACFIYLLNKQIITLKRSFWLSLLMNLTSYILGQLTFIELFWGSW